MLLIAILGSCISKMSAQDEIIEHEGNKYIINVEKLNPDSEMTLMDVLHMCPELISDDLSPTMAESSQPTTSCQLTTSCSVSILSPC